MDTPHIILTDRQRRVLWLLSQGSSRDDITRDYGEAFGSVPSVCVYLYRKLSAINAAHAVAIGLLNGHIGPYKDCGTQIAYRRHLKNDEPTCVACKRGNLERLEMEALTPRMIQLSEPQIRLLRAIDAGRSNLQIRVAWKINESTLHTLVTSTYVALGVNRLAPALRRESALRVARHRGLIGGQMLTATPAKPVRLTETHVRILTELAAGASIAEAAERIGTTRSTCASRLSEIYRRLDVSWMDKDRRRDTAVRKAREAGLLPEPAGVAQSA